MEQPTVPTEPADDDGRPIQRAAVEDEMLRLEETYRGLTGKLRPITPHAPPADPEFRTGDMP